jgi:hypothetical protein
MHVSAVPRLSAGSIVSTPSAIHKTLSVVSPGKLDVRYVTEHEKAHGS